MSIRIHDDDFDDLIRRIAAELMKAISWPPGRVALTEVEAAAAMGVPRHVLRDLRLAGKAKAQKLGRRYVYTQKQLIELLEGGMK